MLAPGLGVRTLMTALGIPAKSHHHLVGDLASSWSQGAISLGLCICCHGYLVCAPWDLTGVTRLRAQILGERRAKDASGFPPEEEPEHKRQRRNSGQCTLLRDLTISATLCIGRYLDRL